MHDLTKNNDIGQTFYPHSKEEAQTRLFNLFCFVNQETAEPIARQLIKEYGTLNALLQINSDFLLQMQGVTTQHVEILATLGNCHTYLARERLPPRQLLEQAETVKSFLMHSIAWRTSEYFWVLFLDTKNRLILAKEMFRGTINEVVAHPREVVKDAIRYNANSVIIAHNHPGNKPNPSNSDILQTNTLIKALKLLRINLLDHFIVSIDGVFSFLENGILGQPPKSPYV